MPIIINIDVMLARRKMSSGELAEKVGITPANLSILKCGKAKGEADAIFAKMDAQARGVLEVLTKQASGFQQLVGAAQGDAQKAVLMMIADKLPELVKTQVEAVKGINIDKVTVWDTGNGADGKTATSNFISGLMKSVPPLDDLFKMAGMELPSYLKGQKPEEQPSGEEK